MSNSTVLQTVLSEAENDIMQKRESAVCRYCGFGSRSAVPFGLTFGDFHCVTMRCSTLWLESLW